MATIQIILQAVNDASGALDEVASSCEKLDAAQINTQESARALTEAEAGAANAAIQAIGAYEELRASTTAVAEATVNAAQAEIAFTEGVGDAARGALTAAYAYRRLTDETLLAQKAAIDGLPAQEAIAGALGDVLNAAMTAAAGIRLLTEEELAAGRGALQTAYAVRELSAAELDARQDSLDLAVALRAAADAEADLAARAAEAAAALEAEAEAERDAAAAAAENAIALQVAVRAEQDAAAAAGRSRVAWGLWGKVIQALTTQIPLWGGALDKMLPHILTQVSGWHLLTDAVVETIAVWVPALITLGVAAAAAAPAVKAVYQQMSDMVAVSRSALPGMTVDLDGLSGGYNKLAAAVQPAVYELWGDALNIAAAKTGVLQTAMSQLVPVLDQVGARIALALESSTASTFFTKGVQDVRLLLTAFGNLFGVLGNFMAVVPGYAQILLQLGTSFLGVVEDVTAVLEPVERLGLKLHGFVVYVGLAVTAGAWLVGMLVNWGLAAYNAAGALGLLITEILATADAEGIMAAVGLITPFGWVALIAGAVAGLIVLTRVMGESSTAASRWAAAQQTAITSAVSLATGYTLLTGAVSQSAAEGLAAKSSFDQLTAGQTATQRSGELTAAMFGHLGDATEVAAQKLIQYQAANGQLSGELATYNTRVASLARTYGGVSNAEALLVASGVTMAQMLSNSSGAWATIRAEVAGAAAGLASMGTQSGVAGNELQALDREVKNDAGGMVADIQKVDQAMSDFIGSVTGAETTFDTYGLGMISLSQANADAGIKLSAAAGKAATDQAKLTTLQNSGTASAAALAGAQNTLSAAQQTLTQIQQAGTPTMDGLNQASLQLNQAFMTQVGNTNSLIATWRDAGLSANLFNQGIADSIAPMETYAKGSSDATDALIALGEQAGYQGPANLADLNSYLGITSGMLKDTAKDTQGVKDAANQATAQEALLTSAMQAQGSYISGQLIGDINNAILAYTGVKTAAANYGTAVAEFGRQSAQAQAASATLTNAIIAAGVAAGDTKGQIAAMIAKILGIPPNVALKIVMTGEAAYSINQTQLAPGTTPGAGGVHIHGAARGWMVSGGTPGTDSVPILAMAGELVVPKHMVDAGAVDHLRGRIPGFAGGGLVLGGDASVMTGQRAVTDYNSFKATFETAVIHAMAGALAGAEKTAAAAAAASGGGGEGKAALQAAATARGWGSGAEWNALNATEMREAGYSLTARNPSSGAYGMAQFINGPSEYYAYGGNPNTASGQATAMLNYIAARYVDPVAAWAHEQNYGWYDQGGLLPPGLSLASNQTGSPELVLPNAVVQGFTMGMQQLHGPFRALTSASAASAAATTSLTAAVTALTAATTAAATASKDVSAAVKKPPKVPLPKEITADQATIAADKASAAMLAAHLTEVKRAITDTPASDKTGLARETALAKTITEALAKANAATARAEADLAKAVITENKHTVTSMQEAIEAITKLLGSGSAAVSPSGLWAKLAADEKTLAAAMAAIKAQTTGSSPAPAAAATAAATTTTAAATTAAATHLAAIKAQLATADATLDGLYTQEKAADAAYKAAAKGSTAKASDLVTLNAAWARIDTLYKTVDALEKTRDALEKTTSASGGASSPGSTGSGYTVVADRKAETDLDQILAVLKTENATLKQALAALLKIAGEADPKAQAAAIGPAVAAALNSAGYRAAVTGKTTRRG
jgi:hypothetical protein